MLLKTTGSNGEPLPGGSSAVKARGSQHDVATFAKLLKEGSF